MILLFDTFNVFYLYSLLLRPVLSYYSGLQGLVMKSISEGNSELIGDEFSR